MGHDTRPQAPVRFEITQSLNGTKTVYIARDPSGVVRLRAENLQQIEKMIAEYKPAETLSNPKTTNPNVDKKLEDLAEAVMEARDQQKSDQGNTDKSLKKAKVAVVPDEVGTVVENAEKRAEEESALIERVEKKELLRNELKEAIAELQADDEDKKKSFWDRLK